MHLFALFSLRHMKLFEDPKKDEDPVFEVEEMKDKGVPLKECVRRIKLAITCLMRR